MVAGRWLTPEGACSRSSNKPLGAKVPPHFAKPWARRCFWSRHLIWCAYQIRYFAGARADPLGTSRDLMRSTRRAAKAHGRTRLARRICGAGVAYWARHPESAYRA